ncbi:transcriptional regulator [Termitidicoccus mucosus]|uniref:Transcriptional regulator n=1 Tax=Termitidicoccus mucosus TaxID=1184151 RepID=A0A178IJU6_9BACT|nr:transcriptional regulator [Opitutaceae bacterium TSB47]
MMNAQASETNSTVDSAAAASSNLTQLSELEREIIAYWVRVATQLGYPRSVGEIFGVVFLSGEPVNADDLVARLGISRSGAGQGLKALLDIGAIKSVHSIANRREHFQMQSDLGVLVKQFLNVRVFPQLEELGRQRSALTAAVAGTGNPHLIQRFDKLQRWQKKAAPLMAVLKTLTT